MQASLSNGTWSDDLNYSGIVVREHMRDADMGWSSEVYYSLDLLLLGDVSTLIHSASKALCGVGRSRDAHGY